MDFLSHGTEGGGCLVCCDADVGGDKEASRLFGEALHLPVFSSTGVKRPKMETETLKLTAALGIDLVDLAGERCEGTVGDLNFFANEVLDFRHLFTVGGLDAEEISSISVWRRKRRDGRRRQNR